jgi:hypothetical protein
MIERASSPIFAPQLFRGAQMGGLRGADFGIMDRFYFEKSIITNSIRTRFFKVIK